MTWLRSQVPAVLPSSHVTWLKNLLFVPLASVSSPVKWVGGRDSTLVSRHYSFFYVVLQLVPGDKAHQKGFSRKRLRSIVPWISFGG